MHEQAIKILRDKCDSMRRVCSTYQFSFVAEKEKVGYIQKLDNVKQSIAALESLELVQRPITKQGRLEDFAKISARMLELAADPCRDGYVPMSPETLREWAQKLLPC